MLRALATAVLILSGCSFSAAGAGTNGNVAWAFTVNNIAPVSPGDGGLVVIVTYSDGTTASFVVAAGTSLRIPANGTAAVVSGGGGFVSVNPGSELYWSGSGWSTTPPVPAGSG